MSPSGKEAPAQGVPDWLEPVAEIEDLSQLDAFWSQRPELQSRDTIARLAREVAHWARREPARAERFSRAADRLARLVSDPYGRALADKARGHLRFLVGDYEEALRLYRSCQKNFLASGAAIEAAVNLGSSMWMLGLLGRYEEAWQDSARAHRVLDGHGDPVLLARVVTNEANILLRQDRHGEALERYRRALALFREAGEVQDIAVTLHNIAVSSIAVSDFTGALESYRELGLHCQQNDLALLAAQADYNIAYLYFFRGEYARAIEIYQRTRRQCEALGDDYHRALCDLDQAEIYLELNLRDDAARLAGLAFDAFDRRGNGYEAAKAMTFLAIAASQQGDRIEALRGFSRARERFEAEGNPAWIAMTDFYRALMHHRLANPREARERCLAARTFFDGAAWTSRVALCDLLLSQIDLQQGHGRAGRDRCHAALSMLETLELPSSSLKALMALGRIEEALGDSAAALEAYRRAHVLVEDLRTQLAGEESKIAFLSDKLEVYESLVSITLSESDSKEARERAFGYMEQAKSRILADLMLSRGWDLESGASDHPELVARVRALRAELSQRHRELDQLFGDRLAAASPGPSGSQADSTSDSQASGGPVPLALDTRIDAARTKGRECERLLLNAIRELRSKDSRVAAIHSAEIASLESIRASIPNGAALVEYFECRGQVYVSVLADGGLEIRALGSMSLVASAATLLSIQMDKSQLGEGYSRRFGETVERTLRLCLRKLYSELVEPIESLLDCEHLILVPHGILHRIPFHALLAGDDYLIDRFDISYSPSASLFTALHGRPRRLLRKSLVLAVPDSRAPEILEEARTVAKILPESALFVGEQASVERLCALAPECRILHIATHGFFREDSPMFSAIQLGGSRLTLLDLYGLELGAELVVLSGCSTGRHKVESGDELIGLSRGLLHAGAQSLVTTLWDVHDRSTADLIKTFYRNLASDANGARALCRAMKETRSAYPSPYHWAPFVLIGKHIAATPVL